MKLAINRDQLADAVAWTARALPARPSIPVLSGLLLDASGDGLTVAAFDYDTSRRCTASADIAEAGRVVLPGRVLTEIVKGLPAGVVDLVQESTEVIIRCGKAEFALPTLPIDDYPTLPDLPEPAGTVDAAALAAAITQTVVATANDDTLPMLSGIRADITTDTITLAATDRYRLATTSIPWAAGNLPAATGIVIPGRQLHDMVKGTHDQATLHLAENMLAITSGTRTTTIRLLDAQYVDYASRVGTEGHTTWAEIEAAPLADAVKRVALVAERHAPVRLDFSHHDVVIRAGGADTGRGSELVDGVTLTGNPIEIAFKPSYLLDALTHTPGPRIRIGMTTPTSAALILPAGDHPYRHLVMPVRLA